MAGGFGEEFLADKVHRRVRTQKSRLGFRWKPGACLSKKGRNLRYFEYSTCTGAGVVGISWNCGIGRSGGAATSLVQQPQEDRRTAQALAEMARNKRIMVGLV